jgi:dUTP pyrophosphatase|tara:strand:- start:1963 stop:2427 length:465 start_codon:yes stop_codon:yes gene_type:complete
MAAAKKGITVKVKHTGKFPLPKYSTKGSAAMDLVAEIGRQQHIIQGSNQLIPTGISIEVPNGYCAKIYARSGIADKRGLAPSNGVGIIDSDYRGQVFVSLANHSEVTQYVEPGERIAQIMIEKVEPFAWAQVDELDETNRGIGGFGSTGEKTET